MINGSHLVDRDAAARRIKAVGHDGLVANVAMVSTIAVATLFLAACGGAGAPSAAPAATVAVIDQVPTSTPEATPSPTPVVTPTPPSHAASGTAHITDSDGYTFDVPYVFAPRSVEKQIAAEKPGLNSLVLQLHVELSVVNTTSGRDLAFKALVGTTRPLGDAKIGLIGLWPSDSLVCTYALGATASPGGAPCGVILASTHLPDTLGAGQTTSAPTYAGIENMAPGLAHVPDSAVAELEGLLLEPQAFVVAYIGSDSGRFVDTCPNSDLTAYLKDQWVVNYVTYSMYNNGLMPIFSTAGTCVTNTLGAQPLPE